MSFLQDCFDPFIGFPLDTPQLAGGRKAGSPIGEFPVAEGKKPWYSQGMSALRRSMHAVYDLKYHFVWIPKYCKRILAPERAEYAEQVLQRVAEEYDMVIDTMDIVEDHVHVFLEAPPRLSPSRIVQILKSISARELFRQFPRLWR
jgi:putative transposase